MCLVVVLVVLVVVAIVIGGDKQPTASVYAHCNSLWLAGRTKQPLQAQQIQIHRQTDRQKRGELGGEAVIQEDTRMSLLLWFDNLQSTRTATEADAVTEGQ